MSGISRINGGQTGGVAAETEAEGIVAVESDPAAAAAAVAVSRADEIRSASSRLESAIDGVASVPYEPERQTLQQWYQGAPPEMPALDRTIDAATEPFRGGEAEGGVAELFRQAAQEVATLGRDVRLLESAGALSKELASPRPDPAKVTALADAADASLLDVASNGNPAARAVMAASYGRSATGGGAFGSAILAAFERAAMTPPAPPQPTAVSDPPPATPAPATPPPAAPATSAHAPAPKPAKHPKAPEGYELLDKARTGHPLKPGAHGPEVKGLQRALDAAGAKPHVAVDGEFGPKTEEAVKHFQRSHDLKVTGEVGATTLHAMDKALGLKGDSSEHPAHPAAHPAHPAGHPAAHPAGHPHADGAGHVAATQGATHGAAARHAAVAAARTQIGVREATGHNDGVPAHRYSHGAHVPWCANFVSWAYRQAGHPLPGNQIAIGACKTMESELKSHSDWLGHTHSPEKGDVIFFGSPPHHVGLVERTKDGRVYTIEGNSGNRVAERSYPIGDPEIGGFARPK